MEPKYYAEIGGDEGHPKCPSFSDTMTIDAYKVGRLPAKTPLTEVKFHPNFPMMFGHF